MTGNSGKPVEERIAELEKRDRKRRNAVRWIFLGVIIVLFIVAALNAHYIRATESTFSQLQEAINAVSAADESGESHVITVEVDHANLLSADYLAGVIPVIIGLAGALVVFLGMERLKAFDERIDSTNSGIDEKLNGFDKKIDQNRTELQRNLTTEVERSVQAKFIQEQEKWNNRERDVTSAQEKSKAELSKHKSELSNELDETALTRLQELEAKAQEYINGLDSYNWLRVIIQEGETEISVPTVEDAHRLTERLRAQKPAGHLDMIRQIVDKVCNTALSGDQDDYHNLTAELARGNMYNEACRILERGLEFFSTDVDLLADLVEYGTKGGMLDKAKISVLRLENKDDIPKEQWNWRCYEFVCDYYKATGNIEKAYQICDEFINAIPDDEHGYRSKAELERLMNPGQAGIENSITALRLALERNITCPQCANNLSVTLLDNGRFEEALEAANRAVRDLAQQQPHVTVAYVFYNRANVYDRMCLQSLENAGKRQSMAESACEDYLMALSLGTLSMIVSLQAQARIKILHSYLSSEGKESVNQQLKEIEEEKTRERTRNIMQLLQGMASNGNDSDDNS